MGIPPRSTEQEETTLPPSRKTPHALDFISAREAPAWKQPQPARLQTVRYVFDDDTIADVQQAADGTLPVWAVLIRPKGGTPREWPSCFDTLDVTVEGRTRRMHVPGWEKLRDAVDDLFRQAEEGFPEEYVE